MLGTTVERVLRTPSVPVMIVAGRSHGQGSLGRALLGRVAGAVLRTASCPVLVVGGRR